MGEAKRRKVLDAAWGTVPRERSKILSLEEFSDLFSPEMLKYIEAQHQLLGRALFQADREDRGGIVGARFSVMTLDMAKMSGNDQLVELIETYDPEKEFLVAHKGGDVMVHNNEIWKAHFKLLASGHMIHRIDTIKGSAFALKV